MELLDLLGSDVLREMAYTQKKAERVITSLERPINDNLLKLWTSPRQQHHKAWIEDLVELIDEVSEIVLRPTNARPPHVFYYKLLFFEPFGGGSAVSNILRRLRRLHRHGCPIQVDATQRNWFSVCKPSTVISQPSVRRKPWESIKYAPSWTSTNPCPRTPEHLSLRPPSIGHSARSIQGVFRVGWRTRFWTCRSNFAGFVTGCCLYASADIGHRLEPRGPPAPPRA